MNSLKILFRPRLLSLGLCICVGIGSVFGFNGCRSELELPNIVIIFADDMGYADLGCFGAEKIRTPYLDRMADEGIRFTDFYVSQAVCSASRASLLTGCYANRVSILGALPPFARHGINEAEMTIAELLKQKDYATAAIGKWHLGHREKFLPGNHGFDYYYGLPYSNDMWPGHPGKALYPELPLMENNKTVRILEEQSQLTTWYTEKSVEFIEANKDRPFFLYLAHSMPHVPLYVSDKFAGKSDGGLYGDVIEEIDWSYAQILATLKRLQLDRNTLIIFTSDNGPWLSYGEHAGIAAPLREGKATAWEGGVRVPCIMRWPEKIPAGAVNSQPAMTIDILPTIAKITGTKLSENKIDGKDHYPDVVARLASFAEEIREELGDNGKAGNAIRPSGYVEGYITEKKAVHHRAVSQKITLKFPFSPKYAAGGGTALVDGVRGTSDYRDDAWQGYEEDDLIATIDFGEPIPIRKVTIGFLKDLFSWIFLPQSITYAISNDNIHYQLIEKIPITAYQIKDISGLKDVVKEFREVNARYLRIAAENIGRCPEWHHGAGGKAWVFADEIMVE